jgi:hypothetical protein
MRAILSAGFLLLLTVPIRGQDGIPFSPPCALPFDEIAMEHPIDEDCGPEGSARNEGQVGQNVNKNDFCAPGPPALVTRRSFIRLQEEVDELGIQGTPADRSALRELYTTSEGVMIGEGSQVHFAGFILEAHYSNVSSGESVNCKRRGRSNNDIHVIVDDRSSTAPANFCRTITAEVSPHFRPEDWETGVLNDLRGRPLRITGNLFYDGIHDPCRPGRRASPARISSWEIHPVYRIDVCRDTRLSRCSADDDSVWIPLSEFRLADEIAHENAEPIEEE